MTVISGALAGRERDCAFDATDAAVRTARQCRIATAAEARRQTQRENLRLRQELARLQQRMRKG
jgi:hypothetical protein